MKLIKNNKIAILIVISVASVYLSLSFGTVYINLNTFFEKNIALNIILKIRIYETIMAFIVGGVLSVSGVVYQAVLKNPLAEPFILGVSGGASLTAALAIISGIASISFIFLPISSFIGAVLALFIVIFMSKGHSADYSNDLILSGVIVSTMCGSLLMFLISFLDIRSLNSIIWWLLGNLEPDNLYLLYIALIVGILGTIIIFFYGREMDAISFGDEISYYLGISYRKSVITILIISSIMVASVTAMSGIIGFVGLIIPHILRKFIGARHRPLILYSFWTGGIFLILCNTVARTVFTPQLLPIGVVTALVGGPIFLWILNRKKKIL